MHNLTIYEPPKKERTRTVPWAFKYWHQFTDHDKYKLTEHLNTMQADKRQGYEGYLHHWCGMPKG